jgi:drug/metabolite transporter (DMT)-like permease
LSRKNVNNVSGKNVSETPVSERPPIPPFIGLLVAILAVSTASVFIRFAQQDAPSLVIAAWRMMIAAGLLGPVALLRRKAEIASITRRQACLLCASGAFLALHFASWITSLEFTTVTSSVVLVNTLPLWVSLAAPLFLKERTTPKVWLGMAVALTGGTVVSLGQGCAISSGNLICSELSNSWGGPAVTGNFLALAGAWSAAGYLLIGRSLRRSLSLVSYTFLVYGIAALLLLGASLVGRLPLVGYSPPTYMWFIALAVIPQLLGHSTYNWALRYLSAPYVSVGLLGEPIGSTILAVIILQEMPTIFEITGGLIIMTGILVVSRSEKT